MNTEDLNAYPVSIKRQINWGDMDALNHVNNAIYFRYFESARMEYFEELARISGSSVFAWRTILANTSCDYIQPVMYPDTVSIGARMTKIGTTSMRMEYALFSENSGLCAKATAILVCYDYEKNKKMPVPPEIRVAIQTVEQSEGQKI